MRTLWSEASMLTAVSSRPGRAWGWRPGWQVPPALCNGMTLSVWTQNWWEGSSLTQGPLDLLSPGWFSRGQGQGSGLAQRIVSLF